MIAPPFVGREKEQKQLRKLFDQKRPRIAVLYGRRRIGKSELIHQSFKHLPVLSFEGLQDQSKKSQITNFLWQLREYAETLEVQAKPIPKTASTWREAYLHLLPFLKQPRVIVFDEFQWMANYRSDAISDLKLVWDQYLSKSNSTLVLCGSIASFMVKKVIKSSALFGRTDLILSLEEFSIAQAQEFLPGRGTDELWEAYLTVGGVPLYLNKLAETSSVALAIQESAFTPTGILFDEFSRIFVSQFGTNKHYRAIIQALSEHPYGLLRDSLAQKIGIKNGGTLTDLLFDLESTRFISSWKPIDLNFKTKFIKYILSDSYLSFYLTMIRPHTDLIQQNRPDLYFKLRESPAYFSWIGRALELVVLRHHLKIAQLLGFDGIDYKVGPYFRPHKGESPGVQIDLVFQRPDNVIVVCEVKWTKSAPGLEVARSVEEKAEILRGVFPRKTILKVLITKEPPTEAVVRQGTFYRVILLDEIMMHEPNGSI